MMKRKKRFDTDEEVDRFLEDERNKDILVDYYGEEGWEEQNDY